MYRNSRTGNPPLQREVAKGYTYFEENDVLFAKITPCLENGKHTLAKGLAGGFGFGTTEFHVVRAGMDVDPRHLFRVLTQSQNIEKCTKSFNGTAGQQRVHPDTLRSLTFLLPPLPEQRAIAAVLDSIDEAIERTEAVIAATERLRDSLLRELLTRGVPGWHTEWKEVPGLGTIPSDWEVVRLGDVAGINQINWDPTNNSPIFYLDLTAVTSPGVLTPPTLIEADQAPSRARRKVCDGDILVSTVRPNLRGFARVQTAPSNLVASTGFAVLTPRLEVDGSLIYHHVMSPTFTRHLESSMTGQAYPAVRPDDVSNYRLPLPSRQEQFVIAELLDATDSRIQHARGEHAFMATLKASVAGRIIERPQANWKEVPLSTLIHHLQVYRLAMHLSGGIWTLPSMSPFWIRGRCSSQELTG